MHKTHTQTHHHHHHHHLLDLVPRDPPKFLALHEALAPFVHLLARIVSQSTPMPEVLSVVRSSCLYIYIYIHIYTYFYITYIYIYISPSIYIYIYIYIYRRLSLSLSLLPSRCRTGRRVQRVRSGGGVDEEGREGKERGGDGGEKEERVGSGRGMEERRKKGYIPSTTRSPCALACTRTR